jgi:hypothetical protein
MNKRKDVAMSGLLLALSDAPPGREAAFNHWYDEHALARLAIPGIETAQRYIALGGQPSNLATYDLSTLEVLESREYSALRNNRPDGEQEMLDSLPTPIDRRTYRSLGGSIAKRYSMGASTHTVAVWTHVRDDAGDSQEQVDLHRTVHGCMRCRRFELVSGGGTQFLVLHDLGSSQAAEELVNNLAWSTALPDEVTEYGTASEVRAFALLRALTGDRATV